MDLDKCRQVRLLLEEQRRSWILLSWLVVDLDHLMRSDCWLDRTLVPLFRVGARGGMSSRRQRRRRQKPPRESPAWSRAHLEDPGSPTKEYVPLSCSGLSAETKGGGGELVVRTESCGLSFPDLASCSIDQDDRRTPVSYAGRTGRCPADIPACRSQLSLRTSSSTCPPACRLPFLLLESLPCSCSGTPPTSLASTRPRPNRWD